MEQMLGTQGGRYAKQRLGERQVISSKEVRFLEENHPLQRGSLLLHVDQ